MSQKAYPDYSRSTLGRGILILSLVHLTSIIGVKAQQQDPGIFFELIPLNIVASLVVLLYYQKHWSPRAILFLFVAFLSGFILEALKNEALIVGKFSYRGTVLGPKLFGTPLVMGVFWLVLTYTVGVMIKDLKLDMVTKCAVGAFTLVLFDIVLEPVAKEYFFWGWGKDGIPILNYALWFGFSFFMFLYFFNLKAKIRNPVAGWVFVVQVGYVLFMLLF